MLRQVRDAVSQSAAYTEDIDDQPAGNYRYDAIGNLVADSAERISQIDWSVYGKILSITKRNPAVGEVERISCTYDASGNRISKLVEIRQRPCNLPLKP